MVDISIVILNYKSRELTLNCVDSIKSAVFDNLKYEIIVVDNNSSDGLGEELKKYPEIVFIQNEINLGMGEGNNVGIKKAHGRYIVIMNPDTLAAKDTFKILYEFMEKNLRVGVVGPKQYNPDGSVQVSCYRWYGILTPIYRRTPLRRFKAAVRDLDRFSMKDFDHLSVRKVDWLLGSFLFCRREAINEVGMFDKNFFMYFEDTDLCRRFWERGWQVVYNPETSIIHNHARESAIPWYMFLTSRAARNHIISWIKYLGKWGTRKPDFHD
jgi:GT2 family glycosyltransferase